MSIEQSWPLLCALRAWAFPITFAPVDSTQHTASSAHVDLVLDVPFSNPSILLSRVLFHFTFEILRTRHDPLPSLPTMPYQHTVVPVVLPSSLPWTPIIISGTSVPSALSISQSHTSWGALSPRKVWVFMAVLLFEVFFFSSACIVLYHRCRWGK